ncbi:hypothetical protein [Ensifer aridi]|uniref:hypothetical protein n=1 Tax=Ensifer aridi TaxID=1708715 RepID=UPI001AECFF8F|nr:hypothetical protein [Ensifer aridi]
MTAIPRDTAFDSTLALLRDGYEFISRRCDRFGTDIFATRIMLRRAVCLRGAAAAEMFYGSECFTRQGAMPWTTLRLLQGKRSVQQLEGPAHRRRKAMFPSLLREQEKLESMRRLFTQEWLRALESWKARDEIVLFDEAQLVLTRAACAWAGIPTELHDPEKLCREFSAMIENAGDHDARRFHAPDRFDPERQISWTTQGFDFIPQGGGEAELTHRCPGEAFTVELTKQAIRLLTQGMSYEVPEQDLTLDLSRIPARPKSGFVMRDVRPISHASKPIMRTRLLPDQRISAAIREQRQHSRLARNGNGGRHERQCHKHRYDGCAGAARKIGRKERLPADQCDQPLAPWRECRPRQDRGRQAHVARLLHPSPLGDLLGPAL